MPRFALGQPRTRGRFTLLKGARLCGTGPHAALPDMYGVGGRYPLGVPLLSGRSSFPSSGEAVIKRAGNAVSLFWLLSATFLVPFFPDENRSILAPAV